MRTSLILIFCLSLISCSQKITQIAGVEESAYNDEMIRWRNDRIRMLTAPEGWLSLTGLYWLKPGKSPIGTSDQLDIIIGDSAPRMLGNITINDNEAYFEADGEAYITQNGNRFLEGPIYSDASDRLTKLNFKSLVFYLIERNGRIGLRVKNTLADKRFTLKEIDHFPTDPRYRIFANFNKKENGNTIEVEDMTGNIQEYIIEGELEFVLAGKKHSLLAFDGGAEYYFVIFNDLSNSEQTYGGGRYIYVSRSMDEEGRVIVDFNKAFNPPCVFTDYATCPVPPEENKLDIKLMAGEKYPVHYVPRR